MEHDPRYWWDIVRLVLACGALVMALIALWNIRKARRALEREEEFRRRIRGE